MSDTKYENVLKPYRGTSTTTSTKSECPNDLLKVYLEASKRNQSPKKFGGELFKFGLNYLFDQFPETKDPNTLKNIIIAHLSQLHLDEICTVKSTEVEARLNLEVIIPFALYWLYLQAVRIPSKESPAARQRKALETALDCLDEYLIQIKQRTELMLGRAQSEAMLYALKKEPAFRGIVKNWHKSVEKQYRILFKRGAPPTREPLARKALEMKTANPRLSWMQITQKLCRCGKQKHDLNCKENLRQGAILLRNKQKT